jgi:hypothetical protein
MTLPGGGDGVVIVRLLTGVGSLPDPEQPFKRSDDSTTADSTAEVRVCRSAKASRSILQILASASLVLS